MPPHLVQTLPASTARTTLSRQTGVRLVSLLAQLIASNIRQRYLPLITYIISGIPQIPDWDSGKNLPLGASLILLLDNLPFEEQCNQNNMTS